MKNNNLGIVISSMILWGVLISTIAIQAVVIRQQSAAIRDLTTVCERLSQVFEEAEEGDAPAVEQKQQPEGITNL